MVVYKLLGRKEETLANLLIASHAKNAGFLRSKETYDKWQLNFIFHGKQLTHLL